jgi:hypothetical protein
VRFEGRAMGEAALAVTRRHSHPRIATDPAPPICPTGIDYLALVTERHHANLERKIAYTGLPDDGLEEPSADEAIENGDGR